MTDTRKPTPVEAAVTRLVEAETELDSLRKVLDKHREVVCVVDLPGGHRPETDEEVIARLAKAAKDAEKGKRWADYQEDPIVVRVGQCWRHARGETLVTSLPSSIRAGELQVGGAGLPMILTVGDSGIVIDAHGWELLWSPRPEAADEADETPTPKPLNEPFPDDGISIITTGSLSSRSPWSD